MSQDHNEEKTEQEPPNPWLRGPPQIITPALERIDEEDSGPTPARLTRLNPDRSPLSTDSSIPTNESQGISELRRALNLSSELTPEPSPINEDVSFTFDYPHPLTDPAPYHRAKDPTDPDHDGPE
jgi:hypothetical protein